MARTTLKLAKPIDRTVAPKAPTPRARSTKQRDRRSVAPTTDSASGLDVGIDAAAKPAAPRSPAHENPDDPRLSKRMSELGLCSRREADEWIENGWVKVDGKVVTTLGVRVPRDAQIEIDPGGVAAPERAGDDPAQQARGLRLRPARGRPRARDGAHQAGEPLGRGSVAARSSGPATCAGSHPPAASTSIPPGCIVFTQDGRVAKRLIGQRLGGREGIPRARRGHARPTRG